MKDNILAEIVYKGTVFTHVGDDPYARDATYNFNHASSIIRMPNDKLLAVWFSGPYEGSPYTCILGSYSSDNGETWSPDEVLQDVPNVCDFDPVLLRDGDRIWLFYELLRVHSFSPIEEIEGTRYLGTYCRYTDDCGKTWSKPRLIAAKTGTLPTQGIRLSNGDLLIAVQDEKLGVETEGVLKSTDGGSTWRRYGYIPHTSSLFLNEPDLVELSDGTVLMYLRANDGYIWQSTSDDNGEFWSEPTRTNIEAGFTLNQLYKLSDGHIVLAYNPCKPPRRTPLVVRFSSDDARTWSKPTIIDEVALLKDLQASANQLSRRTLTFRGDVFLHEDVCYPSICEDSMSNLVVTYSYLKYWVGHVFGDIRVARLAVKTI